MDNNNIPARAWRFTDDHIDLVCREAANFAAVNDQMKAFCAEQETLPVLGLEPPYTMVLSGFKTELRGTQWNEEQQRYEPVDGTVAGDWLRREMRQFRAESIVFKELGIDHIINVNMPQNTLIVSPDFNGSLPMLIMYGAWPGEEISFDVPGLVEMTEEETALLRKWMENAP